MLEETCHGQGCSWFEGVNSSEPAVWRMGIGLRDAALQGASQQMCTSAGISSLLLASSTRAYCTKSWRKAQRLPFGATGRNV